MVDKLERFLQGRIDNYRGLMDECVEAGTDENGYALAVEALQRVQQDAARIATPTEDARERAKVLERALEPFLHAARPILHNDKERWDPDEWFHRLKSLNVGQFRALHEAYSTALGNKETDRHG